MYHRDNEVTELSADVQRRVQRIDPEMPGLSALGRHQLRMLVAAQGDQLNHFRLILDRARKSSGLHWPEMTMVDYGGGLGLMSILARRLGVGRVIYNDLYLPSCQDAELIAKHVGLLADDYVHGDIESVVAFANQTGTDFNVIVSYDVLEHIFDLDRFFSRMPYITQSTLTLVMGTGANVHNPRIRRVEVAKQIDSETKDITKKWGEGLRDTEHSYLKVRADIIRATSPSLNQESVAYLAQATRGLIKPQIEQCVAEFERTGTITYTPTHPTNTCCPHTGYWCEQLVDARDYERMLKQYAETVHFTGGLYQETTLLGRIANGAITVLGKRSLPIAPFILFEAKFSRARKNHERLVVHEA